jgi:hypothetical protein
MFVLIFGLFAVATPPALGQDSLDVDPWADYALRRMAEKLAAARQVSFHVETSVDVVGSDEMRVQLGRSADVALRRPDRLVVRTYGEDGRKGFRFDGQVATLYHVELHLYASAKVSPNIDGALDDLFNEYGYTFPMSDLVVSDPYAALMEGVIHGVYVGSAMVDDVRCHHLAFRSDTIDWQIWIEDSIWHFPRKIVFAFKDLPGIPQFTARMSEWDYGADLSDAMFTFESPATARRIRFNKVDE